MQKLGVLYNYQKALTRNFSRVTTILEISLLSPTHIMSSFSPTPTSFPIFTPVTEFSLLCCQIGILSLRLDNAHKGPSEIVATT